MFIYDTILTADEICNLKQERETLLKAADRKKNLVIFGPRNSGKTSLLKSVIIPEFERRHKRSFTLFCDLMGVKSAEMIHARIETAFKQAFAHAFPKKALYEKAKEFLKSLHPTLEFDPLTGEPSLSLASGSKEKHITFTEIFSVIETEIAPRYPTLIVIDEFQDIAEVTDASFVLGEIRNSFQKQDQAAIFLMGSKSHLLSRLFSQPRAPLAHFGEDLLFTPIDYAEYHKYMQERFSKKKIKISLEVSIFLQNQMGRIPEPINIVCNELYEKHEHCSLSESDVIHGMLDVLNRRQSRFESYFSQFSENEQMILKALADADFVSAPNGKAFLSTISLTARTVTAILKILMNQGVVEQVTGSGYCVSDPLHRLYLKRYR